METGKGKPPAEGIGEIIAGIILGILGGMALAALLRYLSGSKCPQCNQNIPYKANPCPKCGTPLRWD